MNRALATFDEAESHNKLSHFTCQGFDINGVVQAGANDGEEMLSFMDMGVSHLIAFEPLPEAFLKLYIATDKKKDLNHFFGVPFDHLIMVQAGLDNFDGEGTLIVTEGDGKGSSLYETIWDHPEVKKNWNQGQAAIAGQIEVPIYRFASWAEENGFDAKCFDTLQLDTQGNEMEILKGMDQYLNGFKYLCIEISEEPVYKGETPGAELSDWLDQRGFLRDSPITAHNDTFFIRKDIKATTDGLYKGRC